MILLFAAVLAGAMLQRISGIGFAMVVAPFTILVIGPAQGVVLVQICGVASALFVLTQVWRAIDWRAYLALLPGSFAGILAGTLVAAQLSPAVAQAASAGIMLAALAASWVLGQIGHIRRDVGVMGAAGGLAGAMTVLAGVGGVALTALQQATRWDHRSFLATLQPYLITLSSATVAARVYADAGAWPMLGLTDWLAIGVVMALGIALGNRAAARLNPKVAARVTVGLSLLGAVAALIGALTKM